ncbi:MAG: hypothetical protein NTW93_07340 [Phycisphaerae bacterium]|nr:hypothetical protein [Phycisphaerae bacterium]
MQTLQRTKLNYTLEYAINQANITTKPLVVIFCIKPNVPEANARHYYLYARMACRDTKKT